MNKLLLSLLAATALSASAPAMAQAALHAQVDAHGARLYLAATPPWVSIDQRQANLDARIDAGVRSRMITPAEAVSLRGQFRDISNMEAHYRYTNGGLDDRERADLNARFDNLSAKITRATVTPPMRPPVAWITIDQRQANLDARIDAGVRSRMITPAEAANLRAQFRDIANLEAHYRYTTGGLDDRERADLNSRFDNLSAKINRAQATPPWVSIDQRQSELRSRIDQGIRNGALTRSEAAQLIAEFNNISGIEAHYRRQGYPMTAAQRAELDFRFDRLSRKVYINKHDRDVRH